MILDRDVSDGDGGLHGDRDDGQEDVTVPVAVRLGSSSDIHDHDHDTDAEQARLHAVVAGWEAERLQMHRLLDELRSAASA